MKVLFKNKAGGALNSGGIKFISGKEYEVDAKVGKYLLDTFGGTFSEVKPEEVAKVEEVKEVKVEEKPKVTPKVKVKPIEKKPVEKKK